ncbi:MAG: phosphatidate cytidylyltransferase [Panacagrimonas sp.]
MLMQRIATAAVLLPLLIGAIWFLPTPQLYIVLSAAGLLVAWEWSGLCGWSSANHRIAYLVLITASLAFAWWVLDWWPWLNAVACTGWLIALYAVLFPDALLNQRLSPTAMAVIGWMMLIPTLLSLAVVHAMAQGPWRLLFLFFIIFAADTGAYFAGRRFGRRKLAPQVSPGKSVEGAIGGLIAVGLITALAGWLIFQPTSPAQWLVLFALGQVVALFSVLGDLTESLFKRSSGVKDSGTILPGHGGMLDRVDSLLAGAPVMALGLMLTGL